MLGAVGGVGFQILEWRLPAIGPVDHLCFCRGILSVKQEA